VRYTIASARVRLDLDRAAVSLQILPRPCWLMPNGVTVTSDEHLHSVLRPVRIARPAASMTVDDEREGLRKAPGR